MKKTLRFMVYLTISLFVYFAHIYMASAEKIGKFTFSTRTVFGTWKQGVFYPRQQSLETNTYSVDVQAFDSVAKWTDFLKIIYKDKCDFRGSQRAEAEISLYNFISASIGKNSSLPSAKNCFVNSDDYPDSKQNLESGKNRSHEYIEYCITNHQISAKKPTQSESLALLEALLISGNFTSDPLCDNYIHYCSVMPGTTLGTGCSWRPWSGSLYQGKMPRNYKGYLALLRRHVGKLYADFFTEYLASQISNISKMRHFNDQEIVIAVGNFFGFLSAWNTASYPKIQVHEAISSILMGLVDKTTDEYLSNALKTNLSNSEFQRQDFLFRIVKNSAKLLGALLYHATEEKRKIEEEERKLYAGIYAGVASIGSLNYVTAIPSWSFFSYRAAQYDSYYEVFGRQRRAKIKIDYTNHLQEIKNQHPMLHLIAETLGNSFELALMFDQ